MQTETGSMIACGRRRVCELSYRNDTLVASMNRIVVGCLSAPRLNPEYGQRGKRRLTRLIKDLHHGPLSIYLGRAKCEIDENVIMRCPNLGHVNPDFEL
jgi:hypothetical protein